MKRALMILLLVVPGVLGVAIFGYFALLDWTQLQVAYRHFEQVSASGAAMRGVFVAYGIQDIHRTNLFAEGTWTLLSALLAGLGLHRLCGPAQK